jgi:hypothetical protein
MNIYLFMGTHLPELRTCLESLAGHAPESTPVRLFIPESVNWRPAEEAPCSSESYSPESVQWVFNPDEEATVLILLDPEVPQIPQLEKLAEDLRKCLVEPVKVITCVDCAAAEASPQLRAWLEASIYYSDIVLLGNRSTASKPFVRDFQKTYEKNCYPCLFLFLKGPGNPDQPFEILTPDTRRLSQLFDLPETGTESVPDLIIEASCDLDLEESEQDPFRQIDEESGQARAPVPDVTDLIVREAE